MYVLYEVTDDYQAVTKESEPGSWEKRVNLVRDCQTGVF